MKHSSLFEAAGLAAAIALFAGCSSTTGLFLNRDIQENEIELARGCPTNGECGRRDMHTASVMGMAATRRGIVIRKAGDVSVSQDGARRQAPTIMFCSEPPPDAVQSVQAAIELTAARKDVAEGTLKDSYQALATTLAARTPLSETYRSAVYALCQLHMNGAVTDHEVYSLMREITLRTIAALTTAAGKEPYPDHHTAAPAPLGSSGSEDLEAPSGDHSGGEPPKPKPDPVTTD